jgi:hypothetical protein
VSGYIYFIACEPMEAVKIGFTKHHPKRRLAELQTGSPSPLKLLSFFAGTMTEEQKLHQSFAALGIHREWFRFEGKLRDFVWYVAEFEGREAEREQFENALHDVLMQGLWHPGSDISEEDYLATGDWGPFRELLWANDGPWEEI